MFISGTIRGPGCGEVRLAQFGVVLLRAREALFEEVV